MLGFIFHTFQQHGSHMGNGIFLTIEAQQRILALPNFCGLGCAGGGTLSDLGAPWGDWFLEGTLDHLI